MEPPFQAALPEDLVANLRLVVGPLLADEEEQWVARARGRLAVTSGQVYLGCSHAPEYLEADLAQWGPIGPHGRLRDAGWIELEPGLYAVSVLSYLPGDPTWSWAGMVEPDLYGEHPAGAEDPLAYFRRTRPGEEPPVWLGYGEFHEYPRGGRHVDMLIHLQPGEGTISDWEYRKPALCPVGLPVVR